MPIDPDVQAVLTSIIAKQDQHTQRLNNQSAKLTALEGRLDELETKQADDIAALEVAMADDAARTQERFAQARERVDTIKTHIRKLHPPPIVEPRRPNRAQVVRAPNALARKKK